MFCGLNKDSNPTPYVGSVNRLFSQSSYAMTQINKYHEAGAGSNLWSTFKPACVDLAPKIGLQGAI